MKPAPWRVSLLALPLSVLSGLLLALALPPHDLSFFGWFAFAPVLLGCVMVRRVLLAAACGMTASFVCALCLIDRWDDPLGYALLVMPFGSLGLVFGFTTAAASVCNRRISPLLWPVLAACAGVTGELLSTYIFPVNAAIAEHQNPLALRLASVTGIWGVTFLMWLVSAVTVQVIRKQLKPSLLLPVLGLLIMAALLPFPKEHDGQKITAAAVQASEYSDAADQTNKLKGKAELVVWPEFGMNMSDDLPYETARANGIYIVGHFLDYNPGPKPFTCALLISPEGRKLARSNKQHLFSAENRDYKRGPILPPFKGDGFTAGMPICFDAMFTDVTRRLVREGTDILLIPNFDPQMPESLLNHLHSAVVAFRAAENGIPIVWAECSSLSSIFNSHGKRLTRAPVQKVSSVQAEVTLATHRTFYNRTGDWFAYLCVAALLGLIIQRYFTGMYRIFRIGMA